MSRPWSLTEITELDLRLRPNAEPEIPARGSLDPTQTPSDVLKSWMETTRPSDPEAAKFAASAVRGEAWFRLSLLMLSLLSGMGAAAVLLQYGGERLINVSAYLGVLVGGQLLLLFALLVSSAWLRNHRGLREELFLPKAVRDLPLPLSLKAWRWRLFTGFQAGGIAFNLGVLAATLWKVLAFDLAFGWATTLDVTPQTVSSLVEALSAPWGGALAPSLEQIAQSRIVLLEGFAQVDAESTAAWWPFLMMCVGVYGLLPRLLLTLYGSFRSRWILRSPGFHRPDAEQLVQRLTRNPLTYRSSGEVTGSNQVQASLTPLEPKEPLYPVLPPDLESSLSAGMLKDTLATEYGIEVASQQENAGLLLVVEAWQPPLEETLRMLRAYRNDLGPEKQILVLALGLPRDGGGFEAPEPGDVTIWSAKLAGLHDPHLGMLTWESS